MKKNNSCLLFNMAAVMCLFTVATHATEQPVKFIVSDNQIQALGIQTVPLQSQSDRITASFPAQVMVPPTAEQVVSSPVAGLVTQLLVQPDQVVRAGAPLLRMVSPELGQLQLQLLQAAVRATLARQTAQREQALFDEGIIPQRRVQEAEAGLQEAEAVFNQAKAALRLSGMSAATIERIAASGTPQDSITLTAAQGGVITEIAIKVGQRVDAAMALLHVAQLNSLWLDIQIPASESGNWPVGMKIKVAGRDITARVVSASPSVASSSQTGMLRAVIEGKVTQLRPGEFVTVELPAAATKDSWDVPLSAVVRDTNQAHVFIRTPDGFEARPVKVVISTGQMVRVQGSLKAGEQIAVTAVVALKGAWLNAKESK